MDIECSAGCPTRVSGLPASRGKTDVGDQRLLGLDSEAAVVLPDHFFVDVWHPELFIASSGIARRSSDLIKPRANQLFMASCQKGACPLLYASAMETQQEAQKEEVFPTTESAVPSWSPPATRRANRNRIFFLWCLRSHPFNCLEAAERASGLN